MPRLLGEIDADIERLRMERVDAISGSMPVQIIKNRMNAHGIPFEDFLSSRQSGDVLVYEISNGETNRKRLSDLSTFTNWIWNECGYGIHAMWINDGRNLVLHLRRYAQVPVYGRNI